jgi:ribulose-phosphate 3-epimerase
MQAWLAINPETPLKSIIPYTSKVQGILFLGVKPGKEHQSFIPQVYKKIQALRKINNKIPIQVDGGINNSTLPKLAKLKVNYINSGSFISDSKNPKQTYKNLVQLFNTLRGEQC